MNGDGKDRKVENGKVNIIHSTITVSCLLPSTAVNMLESGTTDASC